jgi:hypothetical protein
MAKINLSDKNSSSIRISNREAPDASWLVASVSKKPLIDKGKRTLFRDQEVEVVSSKMRELRGRDPRNFKTQEMNGILGTRTQTRAQIYTPVRNVFKGTAPSVYMEASSPGQEVFRARPTPPERTWLVGSN